MQEKGQLQNFVADFNKILQFQTDIEFAQANPEFADDLPFLQQQFDTLTDQLYIMSAFNQQCDKLDCFLQIQAGAGGTESQDWAKMLLRMYTRFCEREGYECSLQDMSPGEGPGLIHSALLEVRGTDKAFMPYGWLKHEHGVHRLVRISPFDSSNRRHTSFASVWVSPKLNTQVNIDIKEGDLDIRECRASGAGGQHVNKTNSAIQILHKPSGIITQSQQERSQHQNRSIAMDLLKSKLYLYEQDKLQKENQKHIMGRTDVSWGNQIRSYTLHPDKRIKDTRTGYEAYNTQSILDGDIKQFLVESAKIGM